MRVRGIHAARYLLNQNQLLSAVRCSLPPPLPLPIFPGHLLAFKARCPLPQRRTRSMNGMCPLPCHACHWPALYGLKKI
jgi:hypothetical protein